MDSKQISGQLAMVGELGSRQIYDLLFNLAVVYKEFCTILGLTHSKKDRDFIIDKGTKLIDLVGYSTTSFSTRVSSILDGKKIGITSHEYHILYTLAGNKNITANIRSKLLDSLQYKLRQASVKINTNSCAICSYACSSDICLSCKVNVHKYTEYRRDSFVVPINFLNFNIRGVINTAGTFTIRYYDWVISKEVGTIIHYKLVQQLQDGMSMVQYELPFEDYQKKFSVL